MACLEVSSAFCINFLRVIINILVKFNLLVKI
jgi:hypothetical protein